MIKTKRIIALFAVIAVVTTFFAVAPLAFAGYKKFSGTYRGNWQSYDFTCPLVYSASSGKSRLKMTVKRSGKFEGWLRFGSGDWYDMSGRIKNRKITLYYDGLPRKYDYKGVIKGKKIDMTAYNDDVLGAKKCPTGWEQRMKLSK
jgi:hypothetical protein